MSARPAMAALLDSPRWLGVLMIAPAVLYIVLVVGLPFVLAILYAFSGVTMDWPKRWRFWKNTATNRASSIALPASRWMNSPAG